MHLVPADRAHRRSIDEHHVCDAIAGIGDLADIQRQAALFALLGDPTRLTLLLAISAAPDITVTDLAIAVGMNDTTVSQALRLLRATGTVAGRKDGRAVRYRLTADPELAGLLAGVLGHARREATAAYPG
jgi:DNA-binding transcriptional ArsR family regulator